MASQGPHNTSGYSSGQAQMRRNDLVNEDHETNFLQETGTQVKNVAQGAAEIGKGAALGAVSMAKGAAIGAANMAQGAADVVKQTFGMDNNTTTTTTTTHSPGNTANYLNLMDDPAEDTHWPSHHNNPNTRNI
ncbi:hypothetical protein ACH5RR_024580 [Cinchona calisaya]|uniref:Uncharacterized protein n=1 Tax=Cinchona calisaya TaxID=153742 RepID=A0ABD2Z262_9GENT